MILVSCTTSHVGLCTILETIEHDFALMIDTDRQPDSDLAQLAEHETDDELRKYQGVKNFTLVASCAKYIKPRVNNGNSSMF